MIHPMLPKLHVTHVCDLYSARSILEDGHLKPTPCHKFAGEDLLYLFYGRPSFRPKSSSEGKRFASFFPVCFVVKPDRALPLKRIFPFDSGAFPERYSDFMHERASLCDFLLPPNIEFAQKVLEAYYDSTHAYLDVRPLDVFRVARTIETTSYHELLRAFGAGQKIQGDDRLVAIEVQVTSNIQITREQIAKIILPDAALRLADIAESLSNCQVPFETYRTGPNTPAECHKSLDDLVRKTEDPT